MCHWMALNFNTNKWCFICRSTRSIFQFWTQVTYTSVRNAVFANPWYDRDSMIFTVFPEALKNNTRYLSYRSPRSILQPGTQVTYTPGDDIWLVAFFECMLTAWNWNSHNQGQIKFCFPLDAEIQLYSNFYLNPRSIKTMFKLKKSAVYISTWDPGNLHIGM